jgi:hypothetical protein
MTHFTGTRDVIRRISEIETPHADALNEDITDEFPDGGNAEPHSERVGSASVAWQRCCRAGARGDTGDLKSAGTAATAGG